MRKRWLSRAKSTCSVVAAGALVLGAVSAQSAAAEEIESAPVHSSVALKSQGSGYDKDQVLTVDGQPYWYNGLQLRADKLLTQIGYRPQVPIEEHDPSDPNKRSLEQVFKQVAEDGYNTVNVQILWSDLQKDKVTTAAQTQSATLSPDGETADTGTFQTRWVAGDEAAQDLGYLRFDIPDDVENVDGSKVRLYVNSFDDRQTEFGSTKGMYYSHYLNLYGVPSDQPIEDLTWDTAGLGNVNYDGTDLKRADGSVVAPTSVLPNWDPVKRTYFYDLDVTDFVADAKADGQDSVSFLVASSTPADRSDKAAVAAETVSFEPAQSTLDDSSTNNNWLKQPLRPRLFFSDASMESIDWGYYDTLVRYAEKYGLKFEVIWFGSDSTGLASDFRVPFYVFHNYQMTTVDRDPKNVLYNGSIGTPLFQKKVGDPNQMYVFLGDRGDQALMQKEGDMLQAIADHTATLTNAAGENISSTLIGVQTQNEPYNGSLNGTPIKEVSTTDGLGTDRFSRSPLTIAQRDLWRTQGDAAHGGYKVTSDTEFRKYQVWYYNDYLSKRIKQSALPVWTRVNHQQGAPTYLVDINEMMRTKAGVGTYLDFVGIDTYGVGVGDMYKIGNGGHWFNVDKGDNLPAVMEDGMNNTILAEKKFATVAGGALHNGYNACSFDGDALYDAFNPTDACGRTDRPADAKRDNGTPGAMTFAQKIARATGVNTLYNKVGYDLATRNSDAVGGSTLLFFNPTGSTAAGQSVQKTVRSVPVSYNVVNDPTGFNTRSRGFAIERSATEIALGSTETTTFRLEGLAGQIASVELGTYDADASDTDVTNGNGVTDNTWTKLGNAQTSVSGADVIVTVPAFGVARVVTSSPIPPTTDRKIETESITDYQLGSGMVRETWNDGASGGSWVKLGAAGMTQLPVGAKVTFRVNVPDAQTDTVVVTRYRSGTDRATAQLSVNGERYSAPINMRGAAGFAETSPTQRVALNAGVNELTYEVTSAGILGFDYFRFVYSPQFPSAPPVSLVDEQFGTAAAAPAFGFDKDAVIADGVLKLTNGLGNEKTAIKHFAPQIVRQSVVDVTFDWVYNGTQDSKGGVEFRDGDGRLVFALQGSTKQYGSNELRHATTGPDSNSTTAAFDLEPAWSSVPLTPGKTYTLRFQANFPGHTVSYRIMDGSTVLVQQLNRTTAATGLERMVATSAYRVTTNAQTVDNLVIKGSGDAAAAEQVTVAGATDLLVGDSQTLTATVAPADADQAVAWSTSDPAVATVTADGVVTGAGAGQAVITATSVATGTVAGTATVTVARPAAAQVLVSEAGELTVGKTVTLTATVTPATADQAVTWTSSDDTVASVAAEGTVTAVAPGEAVITATSTATPAVSGTSTVTVMAPTPETVEITGDDTLVVGGSVPLSATITPSAADQQVTWSSSDPAVATVSAEGVVTGVAPGEAVITATSVAATGVSSTTTVTVSAPPAQHVDIAGGGSVVIGSTLLLTATVSPSTAIQSVTWSTSDLAVATVSADGVVTGVAAGEAVITATSTATASVVGTATVTVTAPPATQVVVDGPGSVVIGNSVALSATITPSTAAQSVTWSSSNTAVATVSSAGIVTGVSAGQVVITATSVATPGVTGTVTIEVTVPPAPAWSATTVYNTGERVSYQGATYVAQWWTTNDKPGATATGAWAKVGAPTACGTVQVPAWTNSWIYTGGETVVHNGQQWKAKWWTRNQAPGDPNGPWQQLSVCPAP